MSEAPVRLRTHRFALVLSGAVSLGSYEAGVVYQLYSDLFALNRGDFGSRARFAIDAIAGASAGPLTGLVLSKAIAGGCTADDLAERLRATWIDGLSFEGLTSRDSTNSLFSIDILDKIKTEAIDRPPVEAPGGDATVTLSIAMTNLVGIPVGINFDRQGHAQPVFSIPTRNYKDTAWFTVTGSAIALSAGRMQPNEFGDIWSLAVQAAAASASFPVAFPTRIQNRVYKGTPLPFAFVDGGVLANEPIGELIDIVCKLTETDPRLDPDVPENVTGRSYLLVEPDPETRETVRGLSPEQVADYANSLMPALPAVGNALFNSGLMNDFRTAATMNGRIAALRKAFDDQALTPAQREAVLSATGLKGKQEITLQRIPVNSIGRPKLAGAFAGHFGGFFRREYRIADFKTGQNEAREWLTKWLAEWIQTHRVELNAPAPQSGSDFGSYAAGLLGAQTYPEWAQDVDPADYRGAGWFPTKGAGPKAPLTEKERAKIVNTLERRVEHVLDHSFGVVMRGLFRAASWVAEHLWLNRRVIPDPPAADEPEHGA